MELFQIRLNTETTQTLIPSLMAQTKQLEKTFTLIDALDQFLVNINQSLDVMEEKISLAGNWFQFNWFLIEVKNKVLQQFLKQNESLQSFLEFQ